MVGSVVQCSAEPYTSQLLLMYQQMAGKTVTTCLPSGQLVDGLIDAARLGASRVRERHVGAVDGESVRARAVALLPNESRGLTRIISGNVVYGILLLLLLILLLLLRLLVGSLRVAGRICGAKQICDGQLLLLLLIHLRRHRVVLLLRVVRRHCAACIRLVAVARRRLFACGAGHRRRRGFGQPDDGPTQRAKVELLLIVGRRSHVAVMRRRRLRLLRCGTGRPAQPASGDTLQPVACVCVCVGRAIIARVWRAQLSSVRACERWVAARESHAILREREREKYVSVLCIMVQFV